MRIALLLITAVLALGGCERTPTGRSPLALVPESATDDMDKRAFAGMRQARPVVSGGPAGELVSRIAREVTAAARRAYPEADMPTDWEMALFRDPSPNAFALPGGRIGVHTGMVEVAGGPGQLAAVIGHEVGHLLADLGDERLTQELGIPAALYLVGLFSEGEVADEQLRRALGIGPAGLAAVRALEVGFTDRCMAQSYRGGHGTVALHPRVFEIVAAEPSRLVFS